MNFTGAGRSTTAGIRAAGNGAPASDTTAIIVVGIGADGPDSLGRTALDSIASARLLVGGRRHLAFFPDHPAERLVIGADIDALLDRLARWIELYGDQGSGIGDQGAGSGDRRSEILERGTGNRDPEPDTGSINSGTRNQKPETRNQKLGVGTCVVLASGDPCCYGIGPRLVERFGRERVRIVPGVGSVPLLFARLGRDWHDVAILSAHGRPLGPVIRRAVDEARCAILTDDVNTPPTIAAALLDAGVEPSAAVVVGEQLGGPAERLWELALAEVPGRSFDRLNVLAVFRDPARIRHEIVIGRSDDAYAHRAGMITKAEIRAVCLGRLRLRRTSRVWDIGAGCGSLAVEAAGLARQGEVWAVESDPDQFALLAENRRRFGAANLHLVVGRAPEALADLPDPDAVFVGGSGGRLLPILKACAARLRAGGRVVATFAILDHVTQAQSFWWEKGWTGEVTQLSVARSAPIAEGIRLSALNPIFVVTATKPAGGGRE